jgi:hypothetical protein
VTKQTPRRETGNVVSRQFQRWLEQNRTYGEVVERYAHPGKRR